MSNDEQIQWCINRHKETNHLYDIYLPYEFHLRMVVKVANQFIELPPNRWSDLILACWGHDLIEDTRTSYNDCRKVLGEYVANIIYAVSNEKGKNRAERANDKYYAGIIETPGAIFVKLCDRIANVQYSSMTNSRMLEMYRKENKEFLSKLNVGDTFAPMFKYLNILLTPTTERE